MRLKAVSLSLGTSRSIASATSTAELFFIRNLLPPVGCSCPAICMPSACLRFGIGA